MWFGSTEYSEWVGEQNKFSRGELEQYNFTVVECNTWPIWKLVKFFRDKSIYVSLLMQCDVNHLTKQRWCDTIRDLSSFSVNRLIGDGMRCLNDFKHFKLNED